MSSRTLQRNGSALLLAIAAGAVLACGGSEKTERPVVSTTRPCTTPADSVIGLATLRFMKHISPKPHRYLIPVSTDSALPTGAYWALQSSAATLNMYPRDTVQQRKVREQLSAKGSYIMFLVNYHGQRTLPDGRVALDFSGHYLSGEVDGKTVPRTAIVFSCHAEGERFVVETAATAP